MDRVRWQDLVVTDSDGDVMGDLGGMVSDAPANLDDAEIVDGQIESWPGYDLGWPGGDDQWDSQHDLVDWTGFEAALTAARGN